MLRNTRRNLCTVGVKNAQSSRKLKWRYIIFIIAPQYKIS